MAIRSATNKGYTATNTPAVNVPAGAAVDDIMVVDLWVESQTTTVTAVPSGFTQEGSTVSINSGGVLASLRRYWKRLTGQTPAPTSSPYLPATRR